MSRIGVLAGLLVLGACGPGPAPGAPLQVSCDAPTPEDSTAIQVQLDPVAVQAGGRILLRVDSLASPEGPKLNADSGFVVQAFGRTGPGYGCATIAPVGAWVWGPEATLTRSWIHVKSDRPVRVNVWAPDGRVVATAGSGPGLAVEPITWEATR